MPIYEFKCDKCSKVFEILTFSMSEKPNASCPKCKSKRISKLISKVGRGKYSSLNSGSFGDSSMAAGSGCSSCSSSNCSSCGH